MSKLTKQQAKLHAEAVALATKDRLTHDEQIFILNNWQESAQHINTVAGAFFTPYDLACGLAIEVAPGRVIDLCAGIGSLSRAVLDYHALNEPREIVCVELNPAYVEIGKKVVPEATWICADVLEVPTMGLGRFSTAYSNPPFGRIQRNKDKSAPRYKGSDFEFIVIDVAAHIADFGAFIVPQMSAGFTYSGRRSYERQTSGKAVDFQAKTGLRFEAGCGVDTAQYKDQWRGVSPICEIVCVDFTEASASAEPAPRPASVPVLARVFAASELGQFDMFGEAA